MPPPSPRAAPNRARAACRWIALVDDDTFVFPRNLAAHLATLDHHKKVYTGVVSPQAWIPANLSHAGLLHGCSTMDGLVTSYDPYVIGGAGSVLSAAALRDMTQLPQCVAHMRPDGKWWQYQSDWAIGSCAKLHGIRPMSAVRGLFNQYVCVDGGHRPFYCETFQQRQQRHATGGPLTWGLPKGNAPSWAKHPEVIANNIDGELSRPLTLHPIKDYRSFAYLHEAYPRANDEPVHHVDPAHKMLNVLAAGSVSLMQVVD